MLLEGERVIGDDLVGRMDATLALRPPEHMRAPRADTGPTTSSTPHRQLNVWNAGMCCRGGTGSCVSRSWRLVCCIVRDITPERAARMSGFCRVRMAVSELRLIIRNDMMPC